MRLNHNMNSLSIYMRYKDTLVDNSTAMDRISTGLKINGSKDCPEKITQSEKMRLQIKSLESASRNVQDGLSMAQTAEGALSEVSSMLIRIKELVVNGSNGTNSEGDLEAIQNEIDNLRSGINQIATDTEFNGVKMLCDAEVTDNNNPKEVDVLTGFLSDEKMQMPYFNILPKNLGIEDIDVKGPKDEVTGYIEDITSAIKTVANIRGKYGAVSGRLETTSENIDSNSYNLQRAESNIRDADIGEEVVELARTQILIDSSLAITIQTNNIPKDALNILRNSM